MWGRCARGNIDLQPVFPVRCPGFGCIPKGFSGCARWGVSGALNLQSALAGPNSAPRGARPVVGPFSGENDAGPCAVQTCESRQAREGAAVSRILQVPQVHPVDVPGVPRWTLPSTGGARPVLFARDAASSTCLTFPYIAICSHDARSDIFEPHPGRRRAGRPAGRGGILGIAAP